MPDEVIEDLLDRALYFVLPAHCLGCSDPLGWRRQPLNLCPSCRDRLPPPDREQCRLCGATTPTDAWLCVRCRRSQPAFDRLLACWSYEPPAAAVLRAYKFGRLDYLGGHIAEAIQRELGDQLLGHDVVTAVPLHWRRRWRRGFNQAALIAKPLAGRLGLPYRSLLRRVRATAPQTGLTRKERADNLGRAFECWSTLARPLASSGTLLLPFQTTRVSGCRVLLVDDVATTAATVEAASTALREAGATLITALVAAQTPHDTAGVRMSKLDRPESRGDILS